MLRRQFSAAAKRAVIKLEKEGVLGVFDGSPSEERVIMIGLSLSHMYSLQPWLIKKELNIIQCLVETPYLSF